MFSLTWEDTVQVTGIGLRRLKNRQLRNRERVEIAMHLADVENSVRWSVADLLVDTENAILHGAKGNHYADVASKIPYHVTARTLENWASVARRIPYHERYSELSFSHHIELAVLDDKDTRDVFARDAIEHGYSVRQLREAIQRSRNRVRVQNFAYASDMVHANTIDDANAREELERLQQENYLLRLHASPATTTAASSANWQVVQLADDLRVMVRVPGGMDAKEYAKKRMLEVFNGAIV